MVLVSFLKNHLVQKENKLRNSYSHIMLLAVAISMILVTSCSLTKNLDASDSVYMGTDITVTDIKQAKSIREFKLILNDIPQNGTVTGIGNLKIGIHNIFDTTRDKGFKHWVKYKLGNSPIIFTPDMVEITEAKLDFYLKGKGFFSSKVSCDTIVTKNKTVINCDITLNQRHRIDSLVFPKDSVYLTLGLDEAAKRAILKEDDFYDRDRLDYERLRITTLAGNKGYAEFKTNNVHFYVDTVKLDPTVDVYTKIISPTDSTDHVRYILDSILVFPNYTKGRESVNPVVRTNLESSITIVETTPYLNHSLFERLILEDPNRFFNKTLQFRTSKRLQNLGLFQVVNIDNEPSSNGLKNHITQKIFLSPADIQSISGEIELNNRSGNAFGIGASIAYENKNLFGNAENLNISFGGQIETQFGDGVSPINSNDINAKAELSIPRFLFPFINIKENKNFLARTVIKADYTLQLRTNLYSIESFTSRFGYRWRQSQAKLHELDILNVNIINVTNQTPEFLELINQDLRLQQSFTNVLIGGLQYYYTYTSQTNSRDRNSHYLKTSIETSGNLMSLILGADRINPKEIVGLDYAQFTKVTLDFRKYWGFGGGSDLATRLIFGIGRAYGNSIELPYVKQYFVGGSNSLRAFRIRGLGPGSFFVEPDGLTAIESQFVDQTGDLKLEMNIEYRFPVFKYFKSAVFVDAGNIWLVNSPDRPLANFEFKKFYNQIAIGAGLGLRLDFDFFLIRMDIATPLRAPSSNGFTWRFNDIDIFSKTWRQDNLRYNLGIGYPF